MTNPSTSSTISITGGRQYWDHSPAPHYPDSNVITWTVDWKAPDLPDGSRITWYAAGNIADGNFSNVGDRVVLANGSGLIALNASEDPVQSDLSFYPNPGHDELIIRKENEVHLDGIVYFYTINGQKAGQSEINHGQAGTAFLSPGIYFIQVFIGDRSYLLRWSKI
jgi:hypothetical protein